VEELKAPAPKLEPKGQMIVSTGGVYMPPFKMRAMLEKMQGESQATEAH